MLLSPGTDSIEAITDGEPMFAVAGKFFGLLDGDGGEADRVAGAAAADNREVGRDNRGDLGIAAGSLVVGQQQDRLTGARHLDRAGRDRVGNDVPAVAVAEPRAVEPHAHAVGAGRDWNSASSNVATASSVKYSCCGPRITWIGWSAGCRRRRRQALLRPLRGTLDRQRDEVARAQRAPLKAAEPGAQIGRGAAEDRRDRDAAFDGQIGAHRFAAEDDLKHLAAH